ncbi:MAG: sugar phosphate isomerase/epimerase family protein [Methanoregulaceae archaeon]
MLGVSTFCLIERPLGEALDQLAELTDRIEVMDEGPHFLASSGPLESYSAHFSIHAPSRGVNLASLLEPIRKASVEVTDQVFAIAAEVGAPVIVHPGYYAWASERREAEARLAESLAELSRAAEERGVRFFVENMGNWAYFFLKTPEELRLIGDCGFAFDVGHANQNKCVGAFLDCRISHFHLHDNCGDTDAHLAVGEGTIDFSPVIQKIRASGVIPVIEVGTFEGVLASIAALDRMG